MTDKQELSLADLNKAIELNPDDSTAYFNRAKYYYAQGNQELTLINFIKAIELNPNDSDNYYTITEHYYSQGSYDLALAVLTKLIELNPNGIDSCRYYSDRGSCYENQEDNELALVDYAKAIKLNPNYAPVYTNRGSYYRTQKKYDLAIVDLNKSIKLDSSNADSYNARGVYYYDKNIYQLAIVDFNKAIELNPKAAVFYYNRGFCYCEQKKYEKAIADCTKAIELSPNNATYYNMRGIFYFRQKNYKAAIADYTKAIELEPDNAVLYGNRAECYEKLYDYDLALDDYSTADDLVEDDGLSYQRNGFNSWYASAAAQLEIWLFENQNYQYSPETKLRNTLNKLTKEIESEPDSPLLYRKRADIHKQLDEYELALDDFNKAIDLDPECGEAYHERGVFYFEQGSIEFALDDFNKAIKLNPDNSEACRRRGVCYIKQGKDEQALDDFNKTIELNPKSYLAYHNLANYYYKTGEYNLSLDNIDKAIEFSNSLETKKDYCFFAKSVACGSEKYDKAENYIEQMFENIDSKEQQHKDAYLKEIEMTKKLEETNKQLELEIQQKEAVEKRMQKLVEQFTHSLGNIIFPDTIYQVAERLKNLPECRRDTLLLHEAYHAEIIIKLQAELLRQRYSNTNPEKFRLMIRNCRRNANAGEKTKTIEAILNYAVSRVTARFLNQHYAGLETIRNKILTQTNTDLNQLKQKFEDDILLHGDSSNPLKCVEWVNKNLRPIQITQISPLWKKVFILSDSYAEALLFGYFSEILFNAFKYADHESQEFLTLSFAEEAINEDIYLSCNWSNPTTNQKLSGLGTNQGLEAIAEDLKQLNSTEKPEQSLLIYQQDNQFQVTLFFKKDLLIDESNQLKIKRPVNRVEQA